MGAAGGGERGLWRTQGATSTSTYWITLPRTRVDFSRVVKEGVPREGERCE